MREYVDYVDIGHGGSPGILWIYFDDRIHVAPTSRGTHSSIWGDELSMRCWRGRHEPDTARTSICVPEHLISSSIVHQPPAWLLEALDGYFGPIKPHAFNPLRRSEIAPIVQRMDNAENDFLDALRQAADITRDEAMAVLGLYRKLKVVKTDAVMGKMQVKHGKFLDRDVILRALEQSRAAK